MTYTLCAISALIGLSYLAVKARASALKAQYEEDLLSINSGAGND